MSATTSASSGRRYGIHRVCRVWERTRSALYARRASCATSGAGRAPGAPRAAAGPLGPTTAGGHSRRPRSVAVPGRGPSEGARAAADTGWDPRRPLPCAARDASARTPFAPSRAPGRSAAPRRDHHHRGTPPHVGDRRRAGAHGGRRLGLDVRGGRPLERGMCGVARVQSRPPLRRPRTHRARPAPDVRARWRPRSPAGWRCGWTTGVSTCRTTSSIRSNTGASVRASASLRNPKPMALQNAGIGRSRSKRSTAGSFRTSTTCARPSPDFVERYNQSWRLEKLRYLTPIEARRNLPATPGRVVQTSVQETGCGTNRLVGDRHASLREEIFDIAEAEAEPMVEPDRVADDVGRESISVIADRLAPHRLALPLVAST